MLSLKDEVYVIEVNPRSSRTVPFLSKITNIPMANIATKAILGQSIIEQGYKPGLAPNSHRCICKSTSILALRNYVE